MDEKVHIIFCVISYKYSMRIRWNMWIWEQRLWRFLSAIWPQKGSVERGQTRTSRKRPFTQNLTFPNLLSCVEKPLFLRSSKQVKAFQLCILLSSPSLSAPLGAFILKEDQSSWITFINMHELLGFLAMCTQTNTSRAETDHWRTANYSQTLS